MADLQGALPELTPDNRAFWTGGAAGELRIARCSACGRYAHPPTPLCPVCLGRNMRIVAVSGRGKVSAFSINHHPWMVGLSVPYVVAIVELDEQPGLNLTTNIVRCRPESVCIGMRVCVEFEHVDDVWLPLFRPDNTEVR